MKKKRNGIDFLEFWIDQHVPMHGGDQKLAEAFAKQLLVDAAAYGITVEDMDLEGYDIAKYMLESMNVTPAGCQEKIFLA